MSYWTAHKLAVRSIALVLGGVGVLQHIVSSFPLMWALAPALIVLAFGEVLRLMLAERQHVQGE